MGTILTSLNVIYLDKQPTINRQKGWEDILDTQTKTSTIKGIRTVSRHV